MVALDTIALDTGQTRESIPLGAAPTPHEMPAMKQLGEIAADLVQPKVAETATPTEVTTAAPTPVIKPHEPALPPNHHLGWGDVSDRI